MAVKIGDLFFDVYADLSRINKDLGDLEGKFASVGATAAKAIGETIANATAIAVAGITALAYQTVKLGSEFNIAGQRSTAMFTALTGSFEQAQDILQGVNELALDNPIFDADQLQRSTRVLSAYGVAADDAFEMAQSIGLVTASLEGGSKRATDLARAIGQISAAGILQGDEARQLMEFVDIYGLLAKEMGISRVEVRKLGAEHKLLAEDVLPVLQRHLEETFGPVGQSLLSTFGVQASGLRNIFVAIGSGLVQPFIGFASGGALTNALATIRDELRELVVVAEDGSIELKGFLEPLVPIIESIAASVGSAADAVAEFLDSLSAQDMAQFLAGFEGMGPAIAAVGAALTTVFVQAIPFIGRFAAGFNPIVVGLTALALYSDTIRASLTDAFTRIWEAAQPLIPGVKELVANLVGLAEQAIPVVLDLIATAFEELAPVIEATVDATNELLISLGPAFVEILIAVADALKIVAEIVGALPPDLVLMAGALYGLSVLFPTVTVGLVAMSSAMTMGMTAGAGLLTVLGPLALATGALITVLGAAPALMAAFRGDLDYLNKEVSIFEKPFQLSYRAGFALQGGDREQVARTADMEAGFEAAENFNLALLGHVESFAEARDAALQYASALGLGAAGADNFANSVALAWNSSAQAEQDALDRAREITRIYRAQGDAYVDLLEQRAAASGGGFQGLPAEVLEREIDLVKELTAEVKRAWEEVDRLLDAGSDATIVDFFRELPDLAEDLTDALAKAPGILRELDISASLDDVRASATAVIQTLARDYRMSLSDISAALDERGLSAVIEALGTITEETTRAVDPLILKYGQLGASAELLADAIKRLEEQRTTALRAQIDQVSAALRDAQTAAREAREAFDEFFLGTSGGLQGAIDKLVLDIPGIGDRIEEGLLRGGPQGEAAIRQALGQAGSALGNIFRLGLEQGLDPSQIIGMLGPVYGSIQQELAGAMGRIQSQDWSAGFSPQAAQEIREWMASILDPGQIGALFGRITGADSRITGLQAQLEGLQTELRLDVEFSPEQVQGALNEIETELETEPVVTPEAAQMVFDEIQKILANDELELAIDDALMLQEILDVAQAAEDQISMVFKSALSFESAELHEIARLVSAEFYAAFNQRLQELRDEQARAAGFGSFLDMQRALGPAVAGAMVGATTVTTNLNQDIVVNGAQQPIATGREIIAAGSAAAGTGGKYDPQKFRTTGGGGAGRALVY